MILMQPPGFVFVIDTESSAEMAAPTAIAVLDLSATFF
jgi:hypothetical protein